MENEPKLMPENSDFTILPLGIIDLSYAAELNDYNAKIAIGEDAKRPSYEETVRRFEDYAKQKGYKTFREMVDAQAENFMNTGKARGK